jgi:hypothetical protein
VSDRQRLGTTTVMPPAGPGGPPHTRTSSGGRSPRGGGGVPVWVFVVAVLAVALLVGSVVWVMRGPQPGPVAETTSTVTPTVTVETTPSAATTTTLPATSTPKPKPVVAVKEPSLIKKVSGSSSSGYKITVDYVQILNGKAAADAATAAGQESPPPNDYFIENTSKKLRTFTLPKNTPITVLGWGGADATAKKNISVSQFMAVMTSGTNTDSQWADAYYYVTTRGANVTKIAQIFFP